jgi:hypothetical protein
MDQFDTNQFDTKGRRRFYEVLDLKKGDQWIQRLRSFECSEDTKNPVDWTGIVRRGITAHHCRTALGQIKQAPRRPSVPVAERRTVHPEWELCSTSTLPAQAA